MQVDNIYSGNTPSFSAKLSVSALKGAKLNEKPLMDFITSDEILKLQEKAKNVGNEDTLIKVILNPPYGKLSHKTFDTYRGFDMDIATFHNGELNCERLNVEPKNITLCDWHSGKLKERFKPLNILSKWLDEAFK